MARRVPPGGDLSAGPEARGSAVELRGRRELRLISPGNTGAPQATHIDRRPSTKVAGRLSIFVIQPVLSTFSRRSLDAPGVCSKARDVAASGSKNEIDRLERLQISPA